MLEFGAVAILWSPQTRERNVKEISEAELFVMSMLSRELSLQGNYAFQLCFFWYKLYCEHLEKTHDLITTGQ